ncbi:HD-GYP domain-containing protein [Allostreptomyces psammosilenae]|uniref:HD-GYP domain-containing protein n=1 Tax=Allostreptomyces psammosilenae TaxID=1892865 RepID=A0A852ZVP0_9ACTN|nr:HD domain-containing phosphohydrolase [Allostreptomyces psammosilenae]NYI06299.1 hypothetical protein [Allostreptomyces psammosilenae]
MTAAGAVGPSRLPAPARAVRPALRLLAGAVLLVSLAATLREPLARPGVALAFGALIAVGTALRTTGGPRPTGTWWAGSLPDGRHPDGARPDGGRPDGWSSDAPCPTAPAIGGRPLTGLLRRLTGRRRPAPPGGRARSAAGTGPAAAAPWQPPEDHITTPIATAGMLGYALLGGVGGEASQHGVFQTVAVCSVAVLLGALPRALRGDPPALDDVLRQTLWVTVVAAAARPLLLTHFALTPSGVTPRSMALPVVAAGAIALLGGLVDAFLAAVQTALRHGWPLWPLLRDRIGAMTGIGAAVGASGMVTALATGVMGLWAVPLLTLPLVVTQLSFRRVAAVRATVAQTVLSLSRATDLAGCTRPGHAVRVADLADVLGRDLGLGGRELTRLRHAALLHDLGQLSLPEPVPGGATVDLPERVRRAIAAAGADVIRRTELGAEVAEIVARQADPWLPVIGGTCPPLAARILRVANAYEDLRGAPPARTGPGGAADGRAPGGAPAEGGAPGGAPDGALRTGAPAGEALRHLHQGAGTAYDPRVVRSLCRLLER